MMKGFKYDGTHSDTLGLQLVAKRVPMIPPIKDNFEGMAGKDGAWDFGVTYGARPIEVDCVILADSTAALKNKVRALVGFINPRLGARAFIFDDEPDKQYYARLTGQLPLDQIGAFGAFTLQLICPDPFLYSIAEATQSGTAAILVDNQGTYYSKPRLTITHGGGAGTVNVTRSDAVVQTLTFDVSAPSGTYTVDCKEGTITKDAAGADKYLKGDFFALPSGSNTISTTGSITNVDVKFRHTWL